MIIYTKTCIYSNLLELYIFYLAHFKLHESYPSVGFEPTHTHTHHRNQFHKPPTKF